MAEVVVLHVGHDLVLLETRSKILKTAGYQVIPALSVEDAVHKLAGGHVDVVLLCDSIPTHEGKLFAHLVHKHRPLAAVVLVSEREIGSGPDYDETIENRPEKLLQELPQVLAKVKDRIRGRR